jgi:hypothetical protein
MNVYKNSEVSKKFGVSPSTVTLWVQNAIQGKNNLELVEAGINRYNIKMSLNNQNEILKLKKQGLKYRPSINHMLIRPDPKLYEIFSDSQLVEIVTDLEEDKKIPSKFSCFDEGAQYWNDVVLKSKLSYIELEDELLKINLPLINQKLKKFSQVNIIDIGFGNGLPCLPVIKYLKEQKKKLTYTGFAQSERSQKIMSENLKQYFDPEGFQTKVADIDYDVIRNTLFMNKAKSPNSCNLILFLFDSIGSVIDRQRVLLNLKDSMARGDYLVIINALRGETEYITTGENFDNPEFKKLINWMPTILNIKPEYYDKVDLIDADNQERLVNLRLNRDLDIEFMINGRAKVVSFLSNEDITIWHYYSHSISSLRKDLINTGFFQILESVCEDYSEILSFCEVNPLLFNAHFNNK